MGTSRKPRTFAELARAANEKTWFPSPKIGMGLEYGGFGLIIASMIVMVAGAVVGTLETVYWDCMAIGLIFSTLETVCWISMAIGFVVGCIGAHDSGILWARKWSEWVVDGPDWSTIAWASHKLSVWQLLALPVACIVTVTALVSLPIIYLLVFCPLIAVSAIFFVHPALILVSRHKMNKIEAYRGNLEKEAYLAIQNLSLAIQDSSDIAVLEEKFPNFALEALAAAQRRAEMVLQDAEDDILIAQAVSDKVKTFSETEWTKLRRFNW